MKEMTDQFLHLVGQGISWLLGLVELVWTWSSGQIFELTQTPWEHWPLWKQILFIVVAALVAYALFRIAMQLWGAVLNLLHAVGIFLMALVLTLPTILIAGAIALGGLWLMNNFHDVPFLSGLHGKPNE